MSRRHTLVGRTKRTRSAANRKVRSQSSRYPSSSSSSTSAADTRRRRRRPTHCRPTKRDVNLDPNVYFGSGRARARKPLHDAAPTIFRALDTERDGGVSKTKSSGRFQATFAALTAIRSFEKQKKIYNRKNRSTVWTRWVFRRYSSFIGRVKDTCTLARCY